MKRKITVFIALILSIAMLTACSKEKTDSSEPAIETVESLSETEAVENEAEAPDTESSADETEAPENEEPVTEEILSVTEETSSETEATGEIFGAKRDLSAVAGYDFSSYTKSDKKVDMAESKTSKALSGLADSGSIYMAAEYISASQTVYIAVDGNKIAMKMIIDGEENIWHIKGGTITIYDPATMTGYRISANDEINGYLESFGEISDFFDEDIEPGELVNVFEVMIDGKNYTYEYFDGVGIVIDDSGRVCRYISETDDYILYALTNQIPAGTFDEPEGYEISDMTGLEDIVGGLFKEIG